MGDDAEKMLAVRGLSAGNRDIVGGHLQRVATGAETGHQAREMRDPNIPIKLDPKVLDGFPTDDGSRPEHGLRKVLKWEKEHMPISPEVKAKYGTMLDDFAEAMLRKAIVENATETELLAEYEDQLDEFIDDPEDFIEWYRENNGWDGGKPKTDANPHLTGVPGITIQWKHRDAIDAELEKIEKYYITRFEKIHSCGPNDYTDDRFEFATEIEIPFYREYFLNGAIILRERPDKLADAYARKLKELLRNCITEDTLLHTGIEKRYKQEKADNSPYEKVERQGSPLWWEATTKMNEIVKK